MSKTWFITGTSRGLGREWAEAALERGDNVAATARNTESLAPLVKQYGNRVLPIQLDVTDKVSVDAAIARTHKHFGHLDVVVNNAGYALFGTIEEVSEEQVRAQFEAGLFGALWVTQAALPIMREQRSGHIIQVSSIAGVIALPAVGVYNATKWGIEGFTQSLAAEVQSFGIKVTIVEPVVYGTDWSGNSSVQANAIAAYDGIRAIRDSILHRPGQSGDPQATRPAILAIVDAENPPLRIFFGQGGLHIVRAEYEQRLKMWEEWDNVSQAAHSTPSNL